MASRLTPVLSHLRRLAAPANSPADSDAALLDRFVRFRDEGAFATLVSRHGPMVLNAARRVLGDAHAAQDVMQAVFLVLARKASSLRRPEALAPWLYGVAYRTACRARRALARRHALPLPEGEAAPPASTPDPLAQVTGRELLLVLEEEVQRLPQAYRLPVVLVCLEGLSREEAGQRLGCTAGALKGRLERGRKSLHERLVKRGLTLSAALAAVEASRAAGAGMPAGLAAAALRVALAAAGLGKARLALALALVLGVAALGAGALPQPPAPQRPPAERKQATADPAGPEADPVKPARTDRYGDPLPPGALRRLGTLRHRYPHTYSFPQALPDGKTFLVGTPAEVRWVDAATGRVTDSWRLPAKQTVCGLSHDGRLALLRDGATLRLWDLPGRKEVRAFQGKGELGAQVSASFSPDADTVATLLAVKNNTSLLRVWDVRSGRELWRVGQLGRPLSWSVLGFAADGRAVALLDHSDNRVSVRDRATGRVRHAFATLPPEQACMSGLTPDGKAVLFGTAGKAVRAWDLATGKELSPLGGHEGMATTFAVSRDGKIVLTGGQDPFVLVWGWPSGKRRGKIELGRGRNVGSMAVSADGRRAELIIWGEIALRSFDLATGKELPASAEAHRSPVNGVAVTPDGRVVSAGNDDTLRVWDLSSGRQLRTIPTGHPLGVTSLAVRADGRLAATADFNGGKVLLHDLDTGRLVRVIDSRGPSVWGLAFAPRGSLLAFRGGDAGWSGGGASGFFVAVWDADTGREVRRLDGVTESPVFSPDGKLLAAAAGRRVRVWEVNTGRERGGLPRQALSPYAFSADGRVLVCGDWKGVTKGVTLWELASGQERSRIEAPGGRLTTVRVSPDGRWLAFGDGDNVCLADVRRGVVVHTFRGHEAAVNALAFTPDSRILISASFDSTLLVWDVAAVGRPGTRLSR